MGPGRASNFMVEGRRRSTLWKRCTTQSIWRSTICISIWVWRRIWISERWSRSFGGSKSRIAHGRFSGRRSIVGRIIIGRRRNIYGWSIGIQIRRRKWVWNGGFRLRKWRWVETSSWKWYAGERPSKKTYPYTAVGVKKLWILVVEQVGHVVHSGDKGHVSLCWWTKSDEGQVLAIGQGTREVRWLATVFDAWGHRQDQEHGRMDLVVDAIEDQWDTCLEHGGHHWSMLLVVVCWLSLKTTHHSSHVLSSLGLITL
jgi:hypothetical protein